MKDPRERRYLIMFVVLAAAGCAWDLYTKHWAFDSLGPPHLQRRHWIMEGVFALTTSLNEGALFGLGAGYNTVFAVLSGAAAVAISYWVVRGGAACHWLPSVALGLVMAGALGNLYDRLGLHGLTQLRDAPAGQVFLPGQAPIDQPLVPVCAVRDFLYFALINWPVFNFADSFLVTGACLLLLQSLRPSGTPEATPQKAAFEAPALDKRLRSEACTTSNDLSRATSPAAFRHAEQAV